MTLIWIQLTVILWQALSIPGPGKAPTNNGWALSTLVNQNLCVSRIYSIVNPGKYLKKDQSELSTLMPNPWYCSLICFFLLQSFGVDFKHDWCPQQKPLVDIYRGLTEHFCTRRPQWAGRRQRTSVRWQKWNSGHSLGLGLNVFNLQPFNAWRHSWHSESKSSNLKSSVVFQYLQDIQYLQDNKDPSDILARESNL